MRLHRWRRHSLPGKLKRGNPLLLPPQKIVPCMRGDVHAASPGCAKGRPVGDACGMNQKF